MDVVTSVRTSRGSARDHRRGTRAVPQLSLVQLYALRAGYLLLAVGNAVEELPSLIDHDPQWPLMDGVVTCMLLALSALAFLGLRYPVQLLPLLLFESAWKLIWLSAVALPLWTAHQMDPATAETGGKCLLVLVVLAVIPWRYVVAHLVTGRGDRWRREPPGPAEAPS